jgi:predicted  nucleic acid-binding Zn-ribbon protein
MPTELQQVLESISDLKSEIHDSEIRLETKFSDLKTEFTGLKTDVEAFNNKFDNYQKASQSVVNLAFGLIASATIVTLASHLFQR